MFYTLFLLGVLMSTVNDVSALILKSKAFRANEPIPANYSCENGSPQLYWNNAPQNTKSFALIVDDPDAPQKTFVHWVIFNIPANIKELPPQVPHGEKTIHGALQGINDANVVSYYGPCPPPGKVHHYHFKLYALDTMLSLSGKVTKTELMKAMKRHILAQTELVGTFQRNK